MPSRLEVRGPRSGALRAALRGGRDLQARTLALAVAMAPALEPAFVAAGQIAAKRSRLLGGLYWHAHEHLIGRLRRSGRRYRRVVVGGVPLDVDVTDRTGRLQYFHDEPYEPAVTRAIADALDPGDVFLDIGANIGFFSVFAGHLVGPAGGVVAFEPHPGAREELQELARRNNVSGIIDVVPLALADRDGDAVLHLNDEFTSYSTLDPSASPMRASAAFRRSVDVRTTTLDRWLASRPALHGRIRCIKIDVEGAEDAVVAGMTQLLRDTHSRIVCETSIGSAADKALVAAGFTRHQIEPGPGPYGNHLYSRS
jgi:FkbM family methyltransferase